MADVTTVLDQLPAGGGVNTPSSGSYGDVVELEALASALPGAQPQESAPMAAAPPPMTPRPPQPASTGLPAALFAPTTQPDVPVGTPLTQTTPVGGTPQEQRIQLLDAYARDPNMSEVSRQLFARYRDRLIRGGQ